MTTGNQYKQVNPKLINDAAVNTAEDVAEDPDEVTYDFADGTAVEELGFGESDLLDTTDDSELTDAEYTIETNIDAGAARRRIEQLQEDRWLRSQIDYDL